MPLPAFLTRHKETPMPELTTTTAAWPTDVIARYLTVGGATVDLTREFGYATAPVHTDTTAGCGGCGERHSEDWGYDFWANERGEEQPESYEKRGHFATARAREWAQAHAEKCRALPKPTT